jgi:CDP-Glycerol:Poly(glycerophosphate) glycerophosphotransferase
MKVLIWATTFGADLWSFTRYLDQQPGVEVKVVMKKPARFLNEPIAKLFPLKAEIVERTAATMALGISGYQPDVTVFDNEVPPPGKSRVGMALWHGFGWKGPNDVKEMRPLYWQIRLAWGDPLRPNPRFRWQCFGPTDFEHRTKTGGLHPENCLLLGAASHDDLRKPLDRATLQEFYPFDVVSRPTVLIAPTWHYGEVFAHWGGDLVVMEQLLVRLRERGANVILRLHDSFRFDASYTSFLQELALRHRHVVLKFKDHHPDNLLDLQVADVLITNYSSIANLYYATGRPTIHVYPVRSADEEFIWRKRTLFGVFKRKIDKARYIWKFPPEDHGGLLARDPAELMRQVDQSLDDPECCREKTRTFLEQKMLGADGRNCERILEALRKLVQTANSPQ